MVVKKIVLGLLKIPLVRGFAKKSYYSLRCELNKFSGAVDLNIDIPEITPIRVRKSNLELKRINILIPALSIEHVFGGISTALDFFNHLREGYPNARIILTDESSFSGNKNVDYESWNVVSIDESDVPGLTIVPAGDRFNKELPICTGDRFIATAWWTAMIASELQSEQAIIFNRLPSRYVYLIQDFEPGFYPWSTRYGLADSTYRCPEKFVGVINTSILKEFFDFEGYSFDT
ncbi:MAG: hypothetical protein R3250_14370, partial [Melioribacteraceae bacterium]|nr:hypothetical protein [Melioribacteraceae bacterium]